MHLTLMVLRTESYTPGKPQFLIKNNSFKDDVFQNDGIQDGGYFL